MNSIVYQTHIVKIIHFQHYHSDMCYWWPQFRQLPKSVTFWHWPTYWADYQVLHLNLYYSQLPAFWMIICFLILLPSKVTCISVSHYFSVWPILTNRIQNIIKCGWLICSQVCIKHVSWKNFQKSPLLILMGWHLLPSSIFWAIAKIRDLLTSVDFSLIWFAYCEYQHVG